jgi:ADP-ribose pyrophosphatase
VLTFETIQHDAGGRVRFHYVIIDLAAEYIAGEIRPADDAVDARWFTLDEVITEPEMVPQSRELVCRLFFEVV